MNLKLFLFCQICTMDKASVLVEPSVSEHTYIPRYVSKFRPIVLHDAMENKHAMKTMGPPNEELPDPRNYLKKHVGELRFTRKLDVERHIHAERKPKIPPMTVKPSLKSSTTDFVKKAIFQEYKTAQPVPKVVINNHGDKVVLQNLGRPIYILRKDYGLMPQYLQKHIEKEKKVQEVAKKAEKEVREAIVKEKVEEQQAALECLKKMWTSLTAEYGCLPLIIETRAVKNHKKFLEDRLEWVEKNIQYIENYRNKHPFQILTEQQGTKP